MKEPRLTLGEELTADARRLTRLADAFQNIGSLWNVSATASSQDLVRILRRAAALLHEHDRHPRDVNDHGAH